MKQLKRGLSLKEAFRHVVKGSARYTKLGKQRRETGKKIYVKIAYRNTKGQIRFASVKRQRMKDRHDLAAAIRAVFFQLKGYEDFEEVAGYEVEEVL